MKRPFRRIVSPHAKALRANMTDAESRLWSRLRDRRLGGHKFRRHATVHPFVPDFLCVERKLIVEVDGSQHGEAKDADRTAELEALGYRVIRFWNHDVLARTDAVLEAILSALGGDSNCPHPGAGAPVPLPPAGEGGPGATHGRG